MRKYVVIGNGVAAAGCIEGIRSADLNGEITVVSLENHQVYCRPLISYYLENKTSLSKMGYRENDFYEKMNCRVIYGKKAVKIDADLKQVVLDDGETLPYTKICVADGSSPFVPPFEGLESVKNKFSFMTIDDALALEKAVTKKSKVLIIGAGLIGLKCAEGIKDRVSSITVCDLAEHILPSILDSDCAAIMQARLEENGIKFMLSDTAVKFSKNKAQMRSGKQVDFDVLVLAVGVRPNTELIKNINGQVNRGIVVNDRMETNIQDIYAAGDCAEGNDISLGGKRVLALLPNAYMQGHAAGVNMAGGNEVFDKAIPMNSIGFFGLHAMTAGTYYGEEQGGRLYEEKTDKKLKRLYTKDGFLTGFILIGETERAGIYTALIREKVPLGKVDFDMLQKSATWAAFSKDTRQQKFGGVV